VPDDLPEVIPTTLTPAPAPAPPALVPAPAKVKSKISQLFEQKSKELLTSQIGIPIKAIACPGNMELKAGTVYNCQVVTDSGNFTAEIQLNNSQGNFKLNTKGVVVLSRIEESINAAVKQKDGIDVTTDCGGKKIRAIKPGDVFACQVTTVKGQTKAAKVSVKDEYGRIDFQM
jgi:hypothetical protein